MKRKTDISLAQEVREEFEQRAVDKKLLLRLCNNYKLTDNAEEFIAQAEECFPYGNQIIASLYVREKARSGKVVEGTFNGEPHFFVLCDNDRIIDITADQHGGPNVYVGPLVKPWRIQR